MSYEDRRRRYLLNEAQKYGAIERQLNLAKAKLDNEIVEAYGAGISVYEIEDLSGLSRTTIYNILARNSSE